MSPKEKPAETDCSECDKVALEKKLEADESARAFQRELDKLARQREIDLEKIRTEHANSLETAADSAATDLQKARWQSEFDLAKAFHEKLGELAGGSIDRSRDSAKYIQTAAAWIATLYTALLGLVFSVTDNPLPLRGAYAGIFLGLAVAFSAAYLAFVTKPTKVKGAEGAGSLTEQQMKRSDFLVRWVNSTVLDRRWAIRASVLSLALGVAFIPAAFVASSRPAKVPDPPAAPSIPSEIATEVGGEAKELFRSQLESYENAVVANNEASKKSSEEAASISDDESEANRVALAFALLGILAVLIGPGVWGRFRDE